MAAAAGTAAAPGPESPEQRPELAAEHPGPRSRGHPERRFRRPDAPLSPSAPPAPSAEESQRERLSASSGSGTPHHAATADSGAGGVSLEGAQVCAPSPRPPNSVPGGADLVSIFGWTSALTDTSSHKNAVSGQEAGGGCGKAGPQAWGCRSSLKGTAMPGAREGLGVSGWALEELGVPLGKR